MAQSSWAYDKREVCAMLYTGVGNSPFNRLLCTAKRGNSEAHGRSPNPIVYAHLQLNSKNYTRSSCVF